MQLGTTLKRKREAKKLSQQEVADYLEISQKTYCNMESDKSAISISQLASLGHYLDFDVMEELEKQGIVFNQNNKKGTTMVLYFTTLKKSKLFMIVYCRKKTCV
jgi:transcriptional regulator with XRE-family HTH domain